MNKKLSGLVVTGILTTTSLSAVTTFAATSNIASTTKVTYPRFLATALPGAELYSQPYSDTYSWTV